MGCIPSKISRSPARLSLVAKTWTRYFQKRNKTLKCPSKISHSKTMGCNITYTQKYHPHTPTHTIPVGAFLYPTKSLSIRLCSSNVSYLPARPLLLYPQSTLIQPRRLPFFVNYYHSALILQICHLTFQITGQTPIFSLLPSLTGLQILFTNTEVLGLR